MEHAARSNASCSRGTGTSEQPQQRHEHQANTRPHNVQDNIVDIHRSIAPCPQKELNHFDADGKGDRDLYQPPEAKTPPDNRDQDAEWEKEHNVTARVMHAERLRGRTHREACRRTCQRCQTWTEVNSHRSRGSQARIVVGDERSNGKAGEIDDEDQEQDFAGEREAVSASPEAVQPKDQPTGNRDRAHDEKRREKAAIRKKRKEKFGDHVGKSR